MRLPSRCGARRPAARTVAWSRKSADAMRPSRRYARNRAVELGLEPPVGRVPEEPDLAFVDDAIGHEPASSFPQEVLRRQPPNLEVARDRRAELDHVMVEEGTRESRASAPSTCGRSSGAARRQARAGRRGTCCAASGSSSRPIGVRAECLPSRSGRLHRRAAREQRLAEPSVEPAAHGEVALDGIARSQRAGGAPALSRARAGRQRRRRAAGLAQTASSALRARPRDASCSRREARRRPGRRARRSRSARRTPTARRIRVWRRPRPARRDARRAPRESTVSSLERELELVVVGAERLATSRASSSSLASADSTKPTENVLTGCVMFRAISATTMLESSPPLSMAPSGTSLISRTRTASSSSLEQCAAVLLGGQPLAR